MARYDFNSTRKRKKTRLARKRLLFLAVFILFVVLVVTGMRVLSPYRDIQNTSGWAASMREAPRDKGTNYLLYGLKEHNEGVIIEEMFLLNFFSAEEKPHVVYLPGGLLMQRLENRMADEGEDDEVGRRDLSPYYLPGNYYEEGGGELFLDQFSLFLDVPLHYFVELNYEGLPVLVDHVGGAPYNGESLSGEEYLEAFLEIEQDEFPLVRSRQRALALQELLDRAGEDRGFLATSSLLREVSPYLDTNLEWDELNELFSRLEGLFDPQELIVELPGKWEDFNEVEYFEPDANLVAALVGNMGEEFLLPRQMITVEVLNGCGIAGAAGKVGNLLSEEGFQIVNVDDADSFDYERSKVISRKGEIQMAREVAAVVPQAELLREPQPDSPAMVTVIVGQNYPI